VTAPTRPLPTVDSVPATHLPLGRTGWYLWRDAALRSAGFPAARVSALRDPALAAAADAVTAGTAGPELYDAEYAAAGERLRATTARLAATPLLREAIAWQNPALVHTGLDKAAAGEPRNVRGRNHELVIASYLQRYCLKNDTIGFFGPVGWATAEPGPGPATVAPGDRLLARRTTYFEAWAIDALAAALAERPEAFDFLVPRRPSAYRLDGLTLYRPRQAPLVLPPRQAELLAACDGIRRVRDLPGATGDEVRALRDAGLLRLGFEGPVEAYPERTLWDRLAAIGDPAVRDRLLAPLAELVAARDRVAGAAGDPPAVIAAMDALGETFERVTGAAAARRPGRMYAGRTVVYEDTVRDVRVRLGGDALAPLAGPLALLLDSGRWLVGEVARQYERLFSDLWARERARAAAEAVPLARLVTLATPDLALSLRQLATPVAAAVTEFQDRWARVLALPPGVRRHTTSAVALAPAVAREFPAGPAAWSAAMHQTPDLMIAAAGPDALARGDFLWVLGELHLAFNTLESRLFVAQHPDPGRLLAAAEADHGERRVYPVQSKNSTFVTSRVAPPTALLSPGYRYWSWMAGPDAVEPPAAVWAAGDLLVDRYAGRLSVRSRTDGFRRDLLEVVGELLSGAVVGAFAPLAAAPHQPRLVVDRLVVARESWSFPAATGLDWVFVKDEAERYRRARAWRDGHGIPERVFGKVPGEDKPTALDFASLPLVNLFAKAVRKAADAGGGAVRVTEMMPDLDELWLPDAAGERYTAELRFVAVNRDDADWARPPR
jgi:hypothetical protein